MILRAEVCNPEPSIDLEKAGEGRCTYCCTRVEITKQLAEFIAAWPALCDSQRQAWSMLADSIGKPSD